MPFESFMIPIPREGPQHHQVLVLSLWDKVLSWEGSEVQVKANFSLYPSLVPTAYLVQLHQGSETLPERLHPMAKPVGRLALEGLVQPLPSLTRQPSGTGNSLPRGNPLPHPLFSRSPACLQALPCSNALWRKRGAAQATLHADKVSLLLETEA